MKEIIDRILELEAKASIKDWCSNRVRFYLKDSPSKEDDSELISAMRNNIRPLLLRMKALEDCADAAREYWSRYNSDCENREMIKAEKRLESLLTNLDECGK